VVKVRIRDLIVWFLILTNVAIPATNIKFADIQPADVVLVAILIAVVGWFAFSDRDIRVDRDIAWLLSSWSLLILLVALSALCSLRLQFHPPSDALKDSLKMAPWLSAAKLIQIGSCVGGFLFFAQVLGRDLRLLRLAASLYIWIGVINALYAILSWMLLYYYNIDLLGAYQDFSGIRTRALFNEGGPYGLYSVSVILVAAFQRYNFRSITRLSFWGLIVGPVGLSFILSGSKGGIICIVALMAWAALSRLQIRYLTIGAALVVVAIVATPILDQLQTYWNIYQDYGIVAAANPGDLNIVAGRMAAATVIPEMVQAHPIIGVGIGNYSLMRAGPEIDVVAPDFWDVPGAGLSIYAAELGIPLFLFLLWNIWWPIRIVRQSRLPNSVVILVAYQLFAQLIQVQATFFYPWFVCAIGFGFYLANKHGGPHRSPAAYPRHAISP
jgi:hypothetical protein